MTDSEINETIAELCGWKRSFSKLKNEHRWISPDGLGWRKPMDYVNDLNACTEFEQKLSGDDRSLYIDMIYLSVDRSPDKFEQQWSVFRAGSRERCEAFLRMHKKWNCDD